MPTRLEPQFKETPTAFYPPIPPEKLTPAETPTLAASITPEATDEAAPVTMEQTPEEAKKGRRKRRIALNVNNLPEEILQIRLKWFTLYTTTLLALSIFGTAYVTNSEWIQLEIQNYRFHLSEQRQKEADKISRQSLSLDKVMQEWRLPDTPGGGNIGPYLQEWNANSVRSYPEIWEFYAKKCGYTQGYRPTSVSGGTGVIGNSGREYSFANFVSPQLTESHFAYRAGDHAVVVRLRKLPSAIDTNIFITVTK